MLPMPRLVPSLIVAASLMLILRMSAIYHEAGGAFAQTPAPGAAKTAPAAAPANPAASGSATPAAPQAGDAAPAENPAHPKPPQRFTPAEVELLQQLSQRRTELDQRQADQDRRELTLKAVESRVDAKIEQLKQLQAQLDQIINQSEAKDDERLKSLVHIYENMKPQEAATIFDGMDMPSLLELLTRMKDLKTAPILAAMTPEKARAVTIAMAQRKELPEPSN